MSRKMSQKMSRKMIDKRELYEIIKKYRKWQDAISSYMTTRNTPVIPGEEEPNLSLLKEKVDTIKRREGELIFYIGELNRTWEAQGMQHV